jgi:hypothetical protein
MDNRGHFHSKKIDRSVRDYPFSATRHLLSRPKYGEKDTSLEKLLQRIADIG